MGQYEDHYSRTLLSEFAYHIFKFKCASFIDIFPGGDPFISTLRTQSPISRLYFCLYTARSDQRQRQLCCKQVIFVKQCVWWHASTYGCFSQRCIQTLTKNKPYPGFILGYLATCGQIFSYPTASKIFIRHVLRIVLCKN